MIPNHKCLIHAYAQTRTSTPPSPTPTHSQSSSSLPTLPLSLYPSAPVKKERKEGRKEGRKEKKPSPNGPSNPNKTISTHIPPTPSVRSRSPKFRIPNLTPDRNNCPIGNDNLLRGVSGVNIGTLFSSSPTSFPNSMLVMTTLLGRATTVCRVNGNGNGSDNGNGGEVRLLTFGLVLYNLCFREKNKGGLGKVRHVFLLTAFSPISLRNVALCRRFERRVIISRFKTKQNKQPW